MCHYIRPSLYVAAATLVGGCSLIVPSSDDFTYGGDGPTTLCPALIAPGQGSVDRTSPTEAGVFAEYSCTSGFVLTGNDGMSRRQCLDDGTWSGSQPSCAEALTPCAPNPCLNGGSCAETGSSFMCTCVAGEGFEGPTCATPVACSTALTAPLNGDVDRTSGTFGDVASFECNSGYYLVGDRTLTCRSDGTWSAATPACASTGGYPVWPMPGTPEQPFDYELLADTVVDRVTNLEWQRQSDDVLRTRAEALSYCDDLALGSATDWRLPTRVELVSIADYSRSDTVFDPTVFAGILDNYWSASDSAMAAGDAWYVLHDGKVYPDAVSHVHGTRCVRLGPMVSAPEPTRFAVAVDEVTDTFTGLVWQRQVSTSTYDFVGADRYCDDLMLGGRGDWRAPTIGELQTIVDENRTSPTIDPIVFPSTPSSSMFWPATRVPGSSTEAYAVRFSDGYTVSGPDNTMLNVRCVR